MTRQPLVASVCVDYLSHPLSAEGLLLCYQQITRQVAHAPLTAKEAASTFQNKSNTELDLLQQHSYNLAIPNKRDHRPAPVGCQAQLRRMQNALWRRSSQLSLAKDVALVQPETLNWQKECDVLWLYGPLYHPYFASTEQVSPTSIEAESSYLDVNDEEHSPAQDYFNIALSSTSSMPQSISTATVPSAAETTVTTVASPTSSSSPFPRPCDLPSPQPQLQPQPAEFPELPRIPRQQQRHHRRMTTDETPTTTSTTMVDSTPRPLRSASISTSDTALAIKARTTPKKSSLKRLGTRQQQLDELRAFPKSQEYRALSQMLSAVVEATAAAVAATSASTTSTISCLLSSPQPREEDGTCSAPVTPVMGNAPMLLAMPLVPAPTRYHFRSTDRQRRASFPKYSTHPGSSSSLSPSTSTTTTTSSSSLTICGGHLTTSTTTATTGTTTSGSLNGKQLRFSLEVQELLFLPSSPPFRVSRAKPVRANSDPAVHSAATSSFLAPSLGYRHHQYNHIYHQPHHHYQNQYSSQQVPSGNNASFGSNGGTQSCIATAVSNTTVRTTTNGGNTRTMVVRAGAESTIEGDLRVAGGAPFRASRAHHGLARDLALDEEEEMGVSEFQDYQGRIHGEDDKSIFAAGDALAATATAAADYHHLYPTATSFLNDQQRDKRKYHHPMHYCGMDDGVGQDDLDDDDDDEDESDPEDEIFFPTIETISEGDDYISSHGQDNGNGRRIDQQQQQQHKGVLWQMYTVVTGVRDIVAWCGSMVYYSSTL
ncbi:hypothetical protein BGZ73_004396 [Actinomortierella ambigua]|nr:hypothetical protein BGZ73_004396 [Actinomortierella ambigua]